MARGRDNPGQMAAPEKLTATQVSDIDGLDDWRVLLRSLHSSFRSGSMAKGLELAGRIAAAADAAKHHPDLTITYPRVHVSLTTHETRSLTARDVRSEEHTSELQSLMRITYAVFCLKKKTQQNI